MAPVLRPPDNEPAALDEETAGVVVVLLFGAAEEVEDCVDVGAAEETPRVVLERWSSEMEKRTLLAPSSCFSLSRMLNQQ